VAGVLTDLPEILCTMLRHPALFKCMTDTGLLLLGNGALPPRDRELAILRMGWLCHAPYEWGEHVLIAKKAGITSAEIEAITTGSTAPDWNVDDRAVLCAVEELYADAMISDTTWATLAARYNEQQLIELPVVIGQYQAVAYYQNALRLRLHHDNPGLSAR
jgi:alkylhydroperoxidase family enzyme